MEMKLTFIINLSVKNYDNILKLGFLMTLEYHSDTTNWHILVFVMLLEPLSARKEKIRFLLKMLQSPIRKQPPLNLIFGNLRLTVVI